MRKKPGRPKKYTESFLANEAAALLKWFQEDPKRFWLKSFALERGYSPQRLSEFAGQSEEFSEALLVPNELKKREIIQDYAVDAGNCVVKCPDGALSLKVVRPPEYLSSLV